ncbi:cytochrome P450 family protein [Nocardia pneumoniae]|uniref:cytochrome P450 family protein n=1 Tax=Nocardia pneumoniae TaxID=228601 RepID=UPI000300679C|nr:cytochrome P450 [Nocardia pneumoniae]
MDLFTEEFRDNPYPGYARLREHSPVHKVHGPMGVEVWLITRYEEARAALNDPRLSKDARNAPAWMRDLGLVTEDGGRVGLNMLAADPPTHTRLRKLVAKAFTRRRIDDLRPRVQEITDTLIDAMPVAEVDLIAALAFPLPIIVICELLGVPAQDRASFRAWSQALTAPPLTPDGLAAMRQARQDIGGYLTDLIARRRSQTEPALRIDDQPDLVSALVAAADEHDRLSEQELLGTLQLLLVAGHETTVNLIGNGMLALLRHPDQLALLRAQPELLPGAIDELLRYDGPVERATPRYATEDIDVGETTIPAGSVVSIALASANHDPGHTPAANELDITRTGHGNVAFGHGIHYCLGAPLGRIEAEIAIGTLLHRFPDLALARPSDDLRWKYGGVTDIFRGLETLPVRLR